MIFQTLIAVSVVVAVFTLFSKHYQIIMVELEKQEAALNYAERANRVMTKSIKGILYSGYFKVLELEDKFLLVVKSKCLFQIAAPRDLIVKAIKSGLNKTGYEGPITVYTDDRTKDYLLEALWDKQK